MLVFSQKSPFQYNYTPRKAELRRAYAGLGIPESFVLSHSLKGIDWKVVGKVVDPNRPLGWNWVYGLLEYEDGSRIPMRRLTCSKIGETTRWNFSEPAPPEALVLPLQYKTS